MLGNGIQVEGELKVEGPASPAEGGSGKSGSDQAQEAESPAPSANRRSEPKLPKKPAAFSFDALEQAVGAIEARQEEEAESAAYTASVRDFLAKLPDLSAKLIAEHYRQGGQGKLINQQILYRSDLKADPATQFHARLIFVEKLAAYGVAHQAVPDFDTVMTERAIEELALFEAPAEKAKSDTNASEAEKAKSDTDASEKKSRRGIYIIGEKRYVLSPKVPVSEAVRTFAEQKVVPALNALYRLSVEKARKGKDAKQEEFMKGVTITDVELRNGTPGVAIIKIPARRAPAFDRKTKERYEVTQPNGEAKVRSDGQDVWFLDARYSQKFCDRMQRAIQGAVRVALCDISKTPPLEFTDWEMRQLTDETRRTTRWSHAALHAWWDQGEISQRARALATLTPYQFVFTNEPGSVFVCPLSFHWETERKDGTKYTLHYPGLWCLVERSEGGELYFEECDPYSFGLLDACVGAVTPGKNYDGVRQPLQSILRVWDSAVRKAAKSEDPKQQEQIRKWVEKAKEAEAAQSKEGEKAQFSREQHQAFLDSMTPEEREAYESDDGDKPTDEGKSSETVEESVAEVASPSAE